MSDRKIVSMPKVWANIERSINRIYKNQPITVNDPTPTIINCNIDGPINISKSHVMCDGCGKILRHRYLKQHKNSGACDRIIEKIQKQDKESYT